MGQFHLGCCLAKMKIFFMVFLACLNPTSANYNLKSTEKFERERRQLLSDSQFVNEEAFTTLPKANEFTVSTIKRLRMQHLYCSRFNSGISSFFRRFFMETYCNGIRTNSCPWGP